MGVSPPAVSDVFTVFFGGALEAPFFGVSCLLDDEAVVLLEAAFAEVVLFEVAFAEVVFEEVFFEEVVLGTVVFFEEVVLVDLALETVFFVEVLLDVLFPDFVEVVLTDVPLLVAPLV